MLFDQLQDDLKAAMRAKETVKKDVVRAMISDIKLAMKELKRDLTDQEQLDVVKKHVKQVTEYYESYKAAAREELVEEEVAKLEVLKQYLPKQLTEAEVRTMVENKIAELELDVSNKGLLLKNLMPLFKDQTDGKFINGIIMSYVK